MNSKDVSMRTIELLTNIEKLVDDHVMAITTDFVAPEGMSNQQADQAHVLHNRMAKFTVTSVLNAMYKKNYDRAKKELDSLLKEMDIDPSGTPGQLKELYRDSLFTFDKKQNEDGTTTLVVDLVTQLARLGVEKSVVDEAVKAATKPRRGNVYYQVHTN